MDFMHILNPTHSSTALPGTTNGALSLKQLNKIIDYHSNTTCLTRHHEHAGSERRRVQYPMKLPRFDDRLWNSPNKRNIDERGKKTSIRDQPVIKAEAGSEFRIAREMIGDWGL